MPGCHSYVKALWRGALPWLTLLVVGEHVAAVKAAVGTPRSSPHNDLALVRGRIGGSLCLVSGLPP